MLPTDSTRVHCVDPETLAAWVDGGLPAPEAARVETHLASCAHCQAVLAAFSQTEGLEAPLAATVLPFWSRRPVQWAAAALTAAASLTMWTMTRPTAPAAMPTLPAPVQMAQASRVEEPIAPSATDKPVAPPVQDRARAGKSVSPSPAPRTQPPPVAVSPPPTVVASPPPPAPALPPASPPPPRPALMPPPVVVGAAPPVVDPVTMARQAEMARDALAPPPPVFEVISASEQDAPIVAGRLNTAGGGGAGAGRGGGGRSGARSNVAAFAGAPARAPARWRVTASSRVERSLNGGQAWELVTLDPPFVLTAGSAPYQNVCWLVGQDGVVFRTTNGTSFERMPAPDNVHLVRVGATDALRATVTAIDGRVFDTTDGGVTWRPR